MENTLSELFWNASVEDIVKGYKEERGEYQCLICGEKFIKGKIYTVDSDLYEAEKAAKIHINQKHNSMIEYLLSMNTSFTGITETQRQLLTLISEGLSDKEISNNLGIAASTVRNHRFKIREKEKQAKIYLALMNLISNNTDKKVTFTDKGEICDAHKSANAVDDRFNITDKEKETVLKNYLDENGALKSFPSKEKKKIIVLEHITKNFNQGKFYSEKEVNRMLKRIYEDNATLRRALIEYGFLDRSKDCAKYWVKE